MTTYTVTINNSLRSFGIGPTTQWGAMTWGSSKWGEGSIAVQTIKFTSISIPNQISVATDIIKYVVKGITNVQSVASDVVKIPYKSIDNSTTVSSSIQEKNPTKVLSNDIASADSIAKEASIVFSETLPVVEGLESIKIYDNAGFVDEFPGGIPDAIGRIWDNWSKASESSDTSTETTDATTIWSES